MVHMLQKVTSEDAVAAIDAFQDDKFSQMNMFANRLMANAVFGDSENVFLSGFFLKEVADIFLRLKAMQKTPISTAKTVAMKYLSSMKESLLSGKIDVKLSWISFFQVYRDLQDFLVTDVEKKVYTKNLDFSKDAFLWIIRYLKDKKTVLRDPNNLFFKGVLNEFERIFRNHSGDLNSVFTMSLVRAMARLYDYMLIGKSEKVIDEKKLEELLFPQIDNLEKLVYSGDNPQFEEVTHALWILVKEWREQFIKYMEPTRLAQVQVERAIEIPPEMKKKLAESVSETLEKDITPKR